MKIYHGPRTYRLLWSRLNLRSSPFKSRETTYISLVKSHLDYCASIWDPPLRQDSNDLESRGLPGDFIFQLMFQASALNPPPTCLTKTVGLERSTGKAQPARPVKRMFSSSSALGRPWMMNKWQPNSQKIIKSGNQDLLDGLS